MTTGRSKTGADANRRRTLEAIARATRAWYREQLHGNKNAPTLMDQDATRTVLTMIAISGVPILEMNETEAEQTWLWSDLHLQDRASVRIHQRPFWCWRTHDRALKKRWRKAVKPTDTVIHGGDFAPEWINENDRRNLLNTLP